jgi:cytochrome c oxidase assembly factor CtaG
VIYSVYAATAPIWGLTPLEDQQLGGLIMWLPAGIAYMAAALALFWMWIGPRESEPIRRRYVE